jgi:hypothetical protein
MPRQFKMIVSFFAGVLATLVVLCLLWLLFARDPRAYLIPLANAEAAQQALQLLSTNGLDVQFIIGCRQADYAKVRERLEERRLFPAEGVLSGADLPGTTNHAGETNGR